MTLDMVPLIELPQISGQFVRFAGIGAIGTCIHYCTLLMLVELASMAPMPASALGFVLGALTNYAMNYYLNFQSNKQHAEAMTRFFTVAVMGCIMNLFVIGVATAVFTVPYLLAQGLASGIVLFWNFAINRMWTFGEKTNATRYS